MYSRSYTSIYFFILYIFCRSAREIGQPGSARIGLANSSKNTSPESNVTSPRKNVDSVYQVHVKMEWTSVFIRNVHVKMVLIKWKISGKN